MWKGDAPGKTGRTACRRRAVSRPMSLSLESLVPDPTETLGERRLAAELLAFLMVGGTGALAFVVLSTIFVEASWGPPKWLVSTLCYAVLIVPVYLLHRRFTFRSDAPHRQALPRYAGVQLMSLLLASMFSYIAYSVFGLPTPWAPVIVTGLTSGVSFIVLKFWAFARWGERRAVATLPNTTAARPAEEFSR
jgi:putative flippase GtrA